MILDIVAEYITDGDTVVAAAYIIDEVTEVYHPEEVRSGEAYLTFLGNPITKKIKFDKRMGNSEGDFKFIFSHPPRISNINFKVDITLMDNRVFTKTVPLIVTHEDHIPLVENAPEGTDYRSKKRVKEGL
jgi:hypothetical protein